jgi:hypothetical protein
MNPVIWAALIAGVAGVVTGGIGLYSSRSQARREDARQERITRLEAELAEARTEHERKVQAETILARYRDPLITATFELQDRIQNLLRLPGDSVLVYLSVTNRSKLTLESTLFRFAQYFGWTEIVRREIQFLESDASSATRTIQDAIGKVQWAFATDRLGQDFMVWREEQRAIGEEMLADGPDVRTCIGYATFTSRYGEKFACWLDGVAAALQSTFDKRRLIELHHYLIDLGKQLDPEEKRYPWAEWDFRDPHYCGPELALNVKEDGPANSRWRGHLGRQGPPG